MIRRRPHTVAAVSSSPSSSPTFVIKRTRTGLGLFTLEPVAKGACLIEYTGELISSEESNARGGKYLFQLDEQRVIDGKARSYLARYINHSCRPNAKGYTEGRRIWIYAERKIAAGEQITIHYGEEYVRQHIAPRGCQCDECVVNVVKEDEKESNLTVKKVSRKKPN